MFYRYLHTHAYETLRECQFLVSAPGKFNDTLDCAAEVVGHPSVSSLIGKYEAPDFLFNKFNKGDIPEATMLQLLNDNGSLLSEDKYAEIVQKNFKNRSSLNKVLRILCVSKCENTLTDRRMWNRYAKHDGVRLGLELKDEFLPKPRIFRQVKYVDSLLKIDLTKENGVNRQFDILSVIMTKTKEWEPECECRLVVSQKQCIHIGELDFISLPREVVRRVDIGYKMKKSAFDGLVRMIRLDYPGIEIYRMECDKGGNNIKYIEV